MKHQIGMMQGRLTQPKGRGIQFFPFENWEEEFRIARKLGLNEIEFIFDFEDYKQNPLWTIDGVNRIKEIRTETGIQINAVCFDYFMRRAFFKEDVQQVKRIEENTQIIKTILESMKQLQIKLLEIPLVDDSSLKSDKEKAAFREWLLKIIDYADETINIALETDLSPKDFKEYLNLFNHPRVGANYDSGNSSGIGYDLYEEVTTLGDYIFNIHIKDRIYQGTTVSLGTGSADFDRLFKGLSEIKYKHNFILQAARGVEGEEQDNIVAQMEFVSQYIKKYNI
ncbi:L-ribulose-5-phosphate 3-epimerase UlaE [Lachnospiraceae bacterium]|nr:L-ribulose-5-phosphate 3-epimerase UlaE [Lachnospiraceae bacterium]